MMTPFEKRMWLARGVLVLAIGILVTSWFFPQLIYKVGRVNSGQEMTRVLYATDLWKNTFEFLSMIGWRSDSREILMLGLTMLAVFNQGLLLSAPWLVGFYSRARLLLWLARAMAIAQAGIDGYYVVMSMGRTEGLGDGWRIACGAEWVFVVGLFLIPRRSREAPGVVAAQIGGNDGGA